MSGLKEQEQGTGGIRLDEGALGGGGLRADTPLTSGNTTAASAPMAFGFSAAELQDAEVMMRRKLWRDTAAKLGFAERRVELMAESIDPVAVHTAIREFVSRKKVLEGKGANFAHLKQLRAYPEFNKWYEQLATFERMEPGAARAALAGYLQAESRQWLATRARELYDNDGQIDAGEWALLVRDAELFWIVEGVAAKEAQTACRVAAGDPLWAPPPPDESAELRAREVRQEFEARETALREEAQRQAQASAAMAEQSLALQSMERKAAEMMAQAASATDAGSAKYLHDLSASFKKRAELEESMDQANACSWYERSLEIERQLVQLEPNNTECLKSLAESCFKLCALESAEAITLFDEGLEIQRRLVQLEPNNTEYLENLADSCFDHSNELIELENELSEMESPEAGTLFEEANTLFDEGLEIQRRLVQLEPNNINHLFDLSRSFDQLADALQADEEGEGLAEARSWIEQSLEIQRRLVQLEPDNTLYLHHLSDSFRRLFVLDDSTDPAKERSWIEQWLETAQRVVQLEPDNTEYLVALLDSFYALFLLDESTDPAKARSRIEQCLEIEQRLVQLEPDNTSYLGSLSDSFSTLFVLDESTDPAKARSWIEQRLEIAQRLVQLEPDNTEHVEGLAAIANKLDKLTSAAALSPKTTIATKTVIIILGITISVILKILIN